MHVCANLFLLFNSVSRWPQISRCCLFFYEEHGFNFFFCRQRAARCCQDALRSSKTKEEVYHVLRLMVRLSDDVGERGFLDDHQIFAFSSRKRSF